MWDIPTIIEAASAGVSAVATVVIATLTIPTVRAYKAQVKVGQDQVEQARRQIMQQARPVLTPPDIAGILKVELGNEAIDWYRSQPIITGLQNVGTGPAFTICGIFLGKDTKDSFSEQQRYALWSYDILAPGPAPHGCEYHLRNDAQINDATHISGQPLYVPNDAVGHITRLTLTYRDIFENKFASIYDYQQNYGWICIGHFENITQDLYELHEQDPGIQLSRQMFQAAQKLHS